MGKKRVVVIADNGWAIRRVHDGLAKALADEYDFIFYDSAKFILNEFLRTAVVCITTMNVCHDLARILTSSGSAQEINKIMSVCHGTPEYPYISQGSQGSIRYCATSPVLIPYLSSKIQQPIHLVPTGVDPSEFNYRPRSGAVERLGWCGAPAIRSKRIELAQRISEETNIPLSIASTLTRAELVEWYDTVDVLLVTAGPNPDAETGPLPPFEAIVSGVLVIGTAVGNFASLPGPKFATVEEASAILG